MTTLREAAQQALKAIEIGMPFDHLDNVIAPALRAALEQPEQKPAAWVTEFGLAALQSGRSGSVRAYAENGGDDVPLYTREGA